MKDAKQLFADYINSGAKDAGDLFASDGYLELPYLASLGIPSKYTGPAEVSQFLTFLHDQLYPGFTFQNVEVHLSTADQVFANYVINSKSGITGESVHQEFFGHLVAEGGKIKSLREAIDVVIAADAIFPGGLEEVLTDRKAAAAKA
jgi:uncharacterized protein